MIGITSWTSIHEFKERNLYVSQHFFLCGWPLWRYEDELYAVNGVASLWCNFSSCSWQLLVESKSEASWFRYHSGEEQQRTVKLGLSYGNMSLSHLSLSDGFHLTRSQLQSLFNLLHLKNYFLWVRNLGPWQRNRLLDSLVSLVFSVLSCPSDYWSKRWCSCAVQTIVSLTDIRRAQAIFVLSNW